MAAHEDDGIVMIHPAGSTVGKDNSTPGAQPESALVTTSATEVETAVAPTVTGAGCEKLTRGVLCTHALGEGVMLGETVVDGEEVEDGDGHCRRTTVVALPTGRPGAVWLFVAKLRV